MYKQAMNYIIIVLSILMVCFGLIMDFSNQINMSGTLKIVIYVIPMVLLFINMIIQIKLSTEDDYKEKIRKQMLWMIFIIYIIAIFTLLFLGSNFRFIGGYLYWNLDNVNLIPFREIFGFISSLIHGTNTLRNVFINIAR